jgi:hypothetical protein
LHLVLRRLVPLAACLAIAGCGGSDDEGEVRDAVNGLYAGFAKRDSDRVCASLTKKQREVVTKGAGTSGARSCEQVMSIALSFVGDALKNADEAKVTEVEVDGDKATATVEYRGKPGRLALAKEDGKWRVSNLNLEQL